MSLWAVLKDGQPDKYVDDVSSEVMKEYDRTGDIALIIIAQSVINVFDNENLANICRDALERDYPLNKFSVAELHVVADKEDWS